MKLSLLTSAPTMKRLLKWKRFSKHALRTAGNAEFNKDQQAIEVTICNQLFHRFAGVELREKFTFHICARPCHEWTLAAIGTAPEKTPGESPGNAKPECQNPKAEEQAYPYRFGFRPSG